MSLDPLVVERLRKLFDHVSEGDKAVMAAYDSYQVGGGRVSRVARTADGRLVIEGPQFDDRHYVVVTDRETKEVSRLCGSRPDLAAAMAYAEQVDGEQALEILGRLGSFESFSKIATVMFHENARSFFGPCHLKYDDSEEVVTVHPPEMYEVILDQRDVTAATFREFAERMYKAKRSGWVEGEPHVKDYSLASEVMYANLPEVVEVIDAALQGSFEKQKWDRALQEVHSIYGVDAEPVMHAIMEDGLGGTLHLVWKLAKLMDEYDTDDEAIDALVDLVKGDAGLEACSTFLRDKVGMPEGKADKLARQIFKAFNKRIEAVEPKDVPMRDLKNSLAVEAEDSIADADEDLVGETVKFLTDDGEVLSGTVVGKSASTLYVKTAEDIAEISVSQLVSGDTDSSEDEEDMDAPGDDIGEPEMFGDEAEDEFGPAELGEDDEMDPMNGDPPEMAMDDPMDPADAETDPMLGEEEPMLDEFGEPIEMEDDEEDWEGVPDGFSDVVLQKIQALPGMQPLLNDDALHMVSTLMELEPAPEEMDEFEMGEEMGEDEPLPFGDEEEEEMDADGEPIVDEDDPSLDYGTFAADAEDELDENEESDEPSDSDPEEAMDDAEEEDEEDEFEFDARFTPDEDEFDADPEFKKKKPKKDKQPFEHRFDHSIAQAAKYLYELNTGNFPDREMVLGGEPEDEIEDEEDMKEGRRTRPFARRLRSESASDQLRSAGWVLVEDNDVADSEYWKKGDTMLVVNKTTGRFFGGNIVDDQSGGYEIGSSDIIGEPWELDKFLEKRTRQESIEEFYIEYPSAGATYGRDEYGVYAYSTYPDSSVLAGQEKRRFVDSFDTLFEAQEAYPNATFVQGSQYKEPYLGDLPDDGDY